MDRLKKTNYAHQADKEDPEAGAHDSVESDDSEEEQKVHQDASGKLIIPGVPGIIPGINEDNDKGNMSHRSNVSSASHHSRKMSIVDKKASRRISKEQRRLSKMTPA